MADIGCGRNIVKLINLILSRTETNKNSMYHGYARFSSPAREQDLQLFLYIRDKIWHRVIFYSQMES